jgi:hypothetical protein
LVRGRDHQTQIWFSGFTGEDLNVIFYQNMPNLQKPTFDVIVIGWSSPKMVSGSCAPPPRCPPQCSCVVIESSFDPGERLQAPGNIWSPDTLVSSTNKTDRKNVTEILLKVALNTN